MADRIINNHQGTRIANALGKVAENVSDYTATQVTPTDAMKGELISESNAERIVDALDSIKDGAVDVAHGGTGAKTASAARSNLGLGALATLDSVSASEVSGLGTAATKDYTTSVSSGESKLVTSGAVYSALSNKMDKPSGSVGSANQVMYLNNGVFTAGNTLPSSVTVTTSMTSSSTSYAAAASLVYNRFVRAIAPIETGSTASSARSKGDVFIDNSGYLRKATSNISSGSSYSSKSVITTLANMTKAHILLELSKSVHTFSLSTNPISAGSTKDFTCTASTVLYGSFNTSAQIVCAIPCQFSAYPTGLSVGIISGQSVSVYSDKAANAGTLRLLVFQDA